MNPVKIVLESNIAGGKSTVIRQFQSDPRIFCVLEPVDLWVWYDKEKSKKFVYLKEIEEDSSLFFEFETFVLSNYFDYYQEEMGKINDQKIVLFERSFFSAVKIFGTALLSVRAQNLLNHLANQFVKFYLKYLIFKKFCI